MLAVLYFLVTVAGCGTERWDVKVGSDDDSGKVDLNAKLSTVARLVALKPPDDKPAENRVFPTELETFQVHATLTFYKTEKDQDYHLVLTSGSHTMIAEIPSPDCVPTSSPFHKYVSNARDQFESHYGLNRVRASLNATELPLQTDTTVPQPNKMDINAMKKNTVARSLKHAGHAHAEGEDDDDDDDEEEEEEEGYGVKKAVNDKVIVTGVGFFDFIHGQTGVAPNGIELHPILDIQFP